MLSTQLICPSAKQQLLPQTFSEENIAPPNVDCGEFVIVINASKAVLTGKKLEKKFYRHHSGYIGGLKSVDYKTLMATKPELAVELAVKGMLPKNSIGAKSLTRLKVYAGAEHNQQAQQPTPVVVD